MTQVEKKLKRIDKILEIFENHMQKYKIKGTDSISKIDALIILNKIQPTIKEEEADMNITQ